MEELKCPICGSVQIECDDCYDIDNCDNVAVFHYCGHCLNCETSLVWDKIYTFDKYSEIEIDE